VIVEYHLPDANGVSLLEKLKRMVPEVAAILLSEYDFDAVSKDLVHVAVRSFLKKPFDLVELESALSSARWKMKLKPVESLEGERRSGPEDMPVSISK
jgi:YesN/AraC family two-component response regulator